MRTMAAAAILIGTLVSSPAKAEINYPWCVTKADGRISCSFTSFEQCRAGGFVAGSICSQNPRYRGPAR
jgi:Protein of unknown function (DUF3551)